MIDAKQVTTDLFQITLPAGNALAQPWGVDRNVYVFTGESPALLDTGYAQSAPQLHAALEALGIRASDIARIALTSLTADAAGAVDTFPQATVWAALPAQNDPLALARTRYQRIFDSLLALDDKPESWTQDSANAVLSTAFPPPPSDVRVLEDGQPIRLGSWILDAFEAPGLAYASSGYYAADRGFLFPGPVGTITPRPVFDAPGEVLDTLGALGRMSVKKILPVRGTIDDFPGIFFRALSLYATNMRSNMKYIFESPLSSIDLVRADFGYLPEEMLVFATRLLTYDSVFREFAQAGVMHAAEAGQDERFPRYSMGAPGESQSRSS